MIPVKDCILSEKSELWHYLKPSEEAVLQDVISKDFLVKWERKKYNVKSESKIGLLEKKKSAWKISKFYCKS